ncbi:CYFA0S04e02146g1_1 [Cyberlindnera fabianii]|uniref:CYFA0S04e02146g1_1 n=1 Tax=Cyberlindnera fabianii TaxID=36022 RepID=A0A061AR77_CYBFA|nr:CYFA0S04e02146g1_1 [Cyberlindnera fabianii]
MTSGVDALTIPQSFGQDAKIKGLKLNKTPQNPKQQNDYVWKDVGSYLETLTEVDHDNSPFKNDLHLTAPLNSQLQYRVCTLCNRPILTHHLGTHIKKCLELKQQKETPSTTATASTPVNMGDNKNNNNNNNNKKRKLEKEAATVVAIDKKSKKDKEQQQQQQQPKLKKKANQKNKGPVDVERQCGVALPTGGFCARSLTCKTHSMGAKRAVPGRSASYDELLAAYQHRNQVKIAGQAAKAQAEKDEMLHASSATLDSDEETQQVLSGVSRSLPLPLERKNLVSTRVRTNFLRMREMFAGAILPRITNSNGVGGFNGRTALIDIDHTNDYLYLVRAPQRMMLNKNTAVPSAGNTPQAAVQTPPQNTPGAAAVALAQQQQASRNAQILAQQQAAARQKMLAMQQQQALQQQNK